MNRITQEQAFRETQQYLSKKHDCWFQRRIYNKGRHVLFFPMKKGIPSYYTIYKREYYETFNRAFPEFIEQNPEMRGRGESINKESLLIAIRAKADFLLFLHPGGTYKISPMLVYKFCKKHSLIREQKKINEYLQACEKNTKLMQENTYSFPVKLLEKI